MIKNQTKIDELLEENVQSICDLEKSSRAARSQSERIADAIARFCGTISFAWANFITFSVWIIINTLLPKRIHFDPYPFSFLTFMVSLEAIFLSVFILVSENRQSVLDEQRNKLDLQVNLLSEQENTKTLQLLMRMADQLGLDIKDSEVEALENIKHPIDVTNLIEKKEGEDDKDKDTTEKAENCFSR
jgi:uncharacterized membrane protein